MNTMRLAPSEIRYSQDSIRNKFTQYPHQDIYIGQTLDDLLLGDIRVRDIRTIRVMEKRERWYSADNRRLWVFKKLEKLGKCDEIKVVEIYSIPDEKFTTENRGRSVDIRGDPGGYYWKRKIKSLIQKRSVSRLELPRLPSRTVTIRRNLDSPPESTPSRFDSPRLLLHHQHLRTENNNERKLDEPTGKLAKLVFLLLVFAFVFVWYIWW